MLLLGMSGLKLPVPGIGTRPAPLLTWKALMKFPAGAAGGIGGGISSEVRGGGIVSEVRGGIASEVRGGERPLLPG